MQKFWKWYRNNYSLNLAIATALFSLQILHLFWLLTHVIFPKLGLPDLFIQFRFLNWPLILVDYTEIPAIITTSLIYINELRNKNNLKSWLYLGMLNIQWVHLFWITDEFILENIYFTGLLWWTAIAIDYLELPVIIDTVKKLSENIRQGKFRKALEALQD